MLRTRPALLLSAVASLALAATLAVPASGLAAPAAQAAKGKATLTGKVVDSKGKAVTSGFVEIWSREGRLAPDGGAPVATVPLTSKGTYQVTGLLPNTAYYVMAGSPDHRTTWVGNRAANHPYELNPRTAEVKTLADNKVKSASTIKLDKGGVNIVGRIAGHKKADKVTVEACTSYPMSYLDSEDFTLAYRGYCFRGYVAKDGSYLIPGVPSAVAQVKVSSARASRIAIVDVQTKTKDGKVTQNFGALARTKPPAAKVPSVEVWGYYAPGFELTARPTTPAPAGPATTNTYVWTDGSRILDRGPVLSLDQTMIRKRGIHVIVVTSVSDRDIVSFVPGRHNLDSDPSVTSIPLPGRIHGVEAPLALDPTPVKQPWGQTYSLEAPPSGWNYSYQWMCNSRVIAGATNPTYETTLGNIGCTITAQIDATGPQGQTGNTRIWNPNLAVDSRDIDTRTMTVSGVGTIGTALQVLNPPAAEFSPSYQWLRDTLPITGATSPSYTLTAADKASIITLSVVAKAGGYRTLDTVVGRILVPKVKPTITATVPSKATKTSQKAQIPVTVQILDDPLNDVAGLVGTLKVKVGKKTVSKALKATDMGSFTFTLPKLPKGQHKVTVTFTPKDKAVASTTLNAKRKLVVQ